MYFTQQELDSLSNYWSTKQGVSSYSSIGSTNADSHNIDCRVSTNMNNTTLKLEDYRPIHLYFGRNAEDLGDPKNLQKIVDGQPRNIIVCNSWTELVSKLSPNVKTICFHQSELEHGSAQDIVSMAKTLAKLVDDDYDITVTVGITKKMRCSDIKMLQQAGVFGIIPTYTDFGFEETIRGLHALWANIPYWPKHIIDQLPGAVAAKNPKKEIELTPRQEEIYNIVTTKGASNKAIAKMLNITESTVKLHMGQILKKFHVKNRTQLVAFNKHEV